MTVMKARERRLPTRTALVMVLLATVLPAVILAGCGEADTGGTDSPMVLEEAGSIEPGDAQDPNHGDLPYDAHTFEAKLGDAVVVKVEAEGFVPLLKLVEVATGAVLAEWEEEYSDEEALTYTIAGPGMYEARVYALEGGTGAYTLTVSVNP